MEFNEATVEEAIKYGQFLKKSEEDIAEAIDWHYLPITFDNKHNYNALYDTGPSASLINYSAYVSLGQDLDTGYQPFMKNASGEDMGALGQVTCTFTINDQPFTQSFIVCRHMQ